MEKTNTIEFVSEIFTQEDWSDLRLGSSKVKNYLKKLIPLEEVVANRFIPLFDGDKLKIVHLLTLTPFVLYHSYIAEGMFEIREIPIVDLSIKANFFFGSKKEIKKIIVHFDVGDTNPDGSKKIHTLSVPAELENHVLTFMNLINKFKLEYFRHENY